MSTAVEARPQTKTSEPARAPRERGRCAGGGRHTLEQRISGLWEGLHAVGVAECPLCRSRMERVGDSGVCSGCGSVLR